MRTNIVLDDELVAEAMAATGARTKREVVEIALRELLYKTRQQRLRKLNGRGLIAPDYDVGEVRHNMTRDAG